MKTIKGDLIKLALDGKFDVIVHGCNCFCTMGAGIARQMKNTFPEAYEADHKTEEGSVLKLGSYSHATIGKITVINAYTQYDFKGPWYDTEWINVDYYAIRTVFKKLKSDYPGKRIGYPRIGAGLAGGDWELISKIIDVELTGEDHTLVEFAP